MTNIVIPTLSDKTTQKDLLPWLECYNARLKSLPYTPGEIERTPGVYPITIKNKGATK